MRLPKSIRDNLRFLLVEVNSQLKHLNSYFDCESVSVAQRIVDRSGYAYNLMLRIQNACMLQISQNRQVDSVTIRAVSSIAADLERITELSRQTVHQLGYLRESHKLDLSVYRPLLVKVCKSIELIESALLNNDTQLALKLGRTENKLDKSYKKLLERYTTDLKRKKNTEDLVTGLFVAHTIEQMGDALLNISESIISSNMGQPMDTQRFVSLQETVSSWIDENSVADLELKSVAETRSGSGISSVKYTDENEEQKLAIFKDGEKRKLKEELDGVESWHQIYPGVAPEILTYKKSGNSAALLIEHLQGVTFEQIVLHCDIDYRSDALNALGKTLNSVWKATRSKKLVPANFIGQTRKRLKDVYAVHPEFKMSPATICGVEQQSFEQLLDKAEKLEQNLPAPFSVFIHGDFNVDNIIYDVEADKINFIDLHRSTHMDYLQDVSVFMVSNYRLQILDAPIRARITQQIQDFYQLAAKFAKSEKDKFFEARLALGLARSLATSTRFILDKSMSRRMFLRARYLLEQITSLEEKKLSSYKLPIKELFSD